MSQANKFCTNCGASLVPGWRFCGSCGQPLIPAGAAAGNSPSNSIPPPPPQTSLPPPAPPPPHAAGESITGIIPAVSRKKGLMSAEAFNIIVTGKRMIFAEMTSDLVREEAQRASKGAGFLGGIMAAATAGSSLYKRYLTMPPDAALNESPRNFSVDLSRIRKVRIEAGKEIRTYQSMKSNQGSIIKNSQTENGKLEIETAGETLKFDLPNSSVAMAVETAKKAGLY